MDKSRNLLCIKRINGSNGGEKKQTQKKITEDMFEDGDAGKNTEHLTLQRKTHHEEL